MDIEYRALRAAFLAIYADVVSRWGHRYDHAEAEQMWKSFLDDVARYPHDWHRQLVS